MKNKLSDLNNHLFEAIEMLKNNSDPEASENEKIDIPTAKQIAELGKVIIEGAKTQVLAMELISKSQNPVETTTALHGTGIIDVSDQKQIGS